jgi:hypothetical protein
LAVTRIYASSVVPTLLREIWAVHKNLRTRNRKAVSQKQFEHASERGEVARRFKRRTRINVPRDLEL